MLIPALYMLGRQIEVKTMTTSSNTETTESNIPIDNTLYAAIDLGSNSFHMIISREVHGQVQVVDKHKEMVRLRSGLDSNGKLSDKSFQAGIDCLERFGQRIKEIPSENIRAVGTNTLRNAKNSREFLKRAKAALGHPIKIISGQEEARLIYLGVTHSLPASDERRLVMDIGGGSTEFIIGQSNEIKHLSSTEMGCVSVSQRFFPKDKVTAENMAAAISHCRQILHPHRSKLKKHGWDNAIGASGTIKSVCQILEQNQWTESGITLEGMQKLQQALINAECPHEIKLPGLKDERRPVIAGGLAVLIAAFLELNIEIMVTSQNALREGLILDTLGRHHADDSRERSVIAMQQWMKVDIVHAEEVANTARELFKQAASEWSLKNTEYDTRCLLNWACQLHEAGMAISYKRYHHHSAYLISNSDMAGFDQQDKQILSAMMVNSRGKFNTDLFSEIDESVTETLTYLTVLMRLAMRIHRGRESGDIANVTLSIKKKDTVTLTFDENWLSEHPLTQLDLEKEIKHCENIGITLKLV